MLAKLYILILLTLVIVATILQPDDASAKKRRHYYVNPCISTPTYCVTPEGVIITIAPEVTDWTTAQVYDILKANAYQLWLIGPHLKVKVQTTYVTSNATSVGTSGGVWTNFNSIIYLRPSYYDADGVWHAQGFSSRPHFVIAHEYGHTWTIYHLYLTQQNNWDLYLEKRGLIGDTRLDSSYLWSRYEIIADDYRMLFGTPEATTTSHMNQNIQDPRTIDGYKDWFITVWAGLA